MNNYKKYIPNVILSANPNLNPDNYLVIALYDCDSKLAFIKGGQERLKSLGLLGLARKPT